MEINERIERMAELTRQMEDIKTELEHHKVHFELQAEDELKDSKNKTVSWKSDNGKVTVTESASVKVLAPSVLKKLFGTSYNDYVKEETKCDIKQAGVKRVLSAVFNGEYIELTPQDVINQISDDPKTRDTLRKKIKGVNFAKDSENIMSLTGCSRNEADDYAYLFAEAVAYNSFADYTEHNFDEAVDMLRRAVIVDESIKVAFEGI